MCLNCVHKNFQSIFTACEYSFIKGDDFCDDLTNNEVCEWDGGDCCGNNTNTKYCKDCECNEGM